MLRKIGFSLSCLLLPMMAFAICDNDKIYIQLEDLVFDSNGIWLKSPLNPVAIGIESIHIDSFGYYVSKEEQKETWLCPQCGFVNQGRYPGFWGCWNCGFPFR